MRVRATAVVIKDKKLLMIHRFKDPEEYFVLPGGGVEDGETYEKAAIRELKEETSLDSEVKEKLIEYKDIRGEYHVLFLCNPKNNLEVKLEDGSIELQIMNEQNKFKPEWVDINKLIDLTIYPKEEKEFLLNYLK